MNEQFIKDVKKGVKNSHINQALVPGSTPRRYEPAAGVKKHNERIHRESRYADEHKKLPFSFRKPFKPIGRSAYVRCDNCGGLHSGTVATVGIICEACGKFSTVTEVKFDW